MPLTMTKVACNQNARNAISGAIFLYDTGVADMIHKLYFPDLGLVNTAEMFQQAMAEGFAVPAYNFNTWNSSRPSLQAVWQPSLR